jgi:hypothetical protein
MKKKVILVLVTSLAATAMGTAFADDASKADDFTIDGGIYTQYRVQRDSNYANGIHDNTKTGFRTDIKLNFNEKITNNFDIYARYSYENINVGTSINGKAFMSNSFIGDDTDYNGAIDAYGLKYNNAGIKYTIGSQPLTLGGGILYDNCYLGRYANPYAVKVEGKLGEINLMAVYARTHYQPGVTNDKFYVIQGNYDLSSKANIGAMLAHVAYGNSTVAEMVLPYSNMNAYSVYGSYKLTDQLTASIELLKTSAPLDNKAYTSALSYKIDSKNTIGAGYYRAEENTSIFDYNLYDMTTTDNNNSKGWDFYWSHKLNKNIRMGVSDYIYKKINATSDTGAGTDRSRFTANLSVVF